MVVRKWLLFVLFVSLLEAKSLTATINNQTVEYYLPDTVETLRSDAEKPLSFQALLVDPTPLPENYKPRVFKLTDERLRTMAAVSNDFNITYIAAGETDAYGETCYTFPDEAKAAFEYAAQIWSSYIVTDVPIRIQTCWASLSEHTLGYSGFHSKRDFPGAPYSGTYYSYALADALAGEDLDPDHYDTRITYNGDFSWYYGTDGNTPRDEVDLVSVVLHEMTHSLNFGGEMSYRSGNGYLVNYPYPNIWDRFIVNGSCMALLNFENNSSALGDQLTGGDLYFSGTNTNAANGGSKAKIYAPSTWLPGSSYAHLGYNTFNGTANELMVFAFSRGKAIHLPGPIVLGMLTDMGWTMEYSDACTYTINPSPADFGPSGGSGSIEVTATPLECSRGSWSATESLDWVSLSGDTNGSGYGTWTISYDVNENSSYFRSGIITVGNGTHKINQAGEIVDLALDPETNLMWEDEPYTQEETAAYEAKTETGKVLEWESAAAYCEALELGGYTDWHLPMQTELEGIVDTSNNPDIKNIFSNFPERSTYSRTFWSSTEHNVTHGIGVNFDNGRTDYDSKTLSYYVRCVRAKTVTGSGGGCTYNPNNERIDMMFIFLFLLAAAYPFRDKIIKCHNALH
jgi:hypothetical protein